MSWEEDPPLSLPTPFYSYSTPYPPAPLLFFFSLYIHRFQWAALPATSTTQIHRLFIATSYTPCCPIAFLLFSYLHPPIVKSSPASETTGPRDPTPGRTLLWEMSAPDRIMSLQAVHKLCLLAPLAIVSRRGSQRELSELLKEWISILSLGDTCSGSDVVK